MKGSARAAHVHTAAAAFVTACLSLALAVPPALGQARPPGERGPARGQQGPPSGVTPAELQRMFDALVLMEAQDALQLTEDQYPPFLRRLRTLQDVRRRHTLERQRLLQELRRMSNAPADTALEGSMKVRLRELSDLDVRFTSETRKALESLDEVLDIRQQVRFRLFEEQMERRKVDLLTRARQGNRNRP